MSEDSEEIKTLSLQNLTCIIWPTRLPKENASYLNEFSEHIKIKFNETTAGKYNKELNEFSNLRNIALSALSDNSLHDENSIKALERYYCQLIFMLSRFKDCHAIFPWKDSFSRSSNDGGLDFELNNIMYNIAAIHNELGSKITKNTEPSAHRALCHFNSALWWVTELRDNRNGQKPKEMGHDMLTFYHHILKAHSHECVLVHSIRTLMKLENIASIAAQIASDYDVASKLACSPLYTDPLKEIMGGASLFPTWKITVDFKHKYYSAISYLLMGLANSDNNPKEIGMRIARLEQASQYLESCKKLVSDTLEPTVTKAVYSTLEELINRKLKKAIRYNDHVYYASVPSKETLPQPKRMLLTSPKPFSIESIRNFKDLFSSLVTIESVQTSSLYSQRKDDLSRQISHQVEKQDEDLVQMMSTLNIDKKSLRLPPLEAPDELVEICAELSMNPNVVDDVLTKLEELDDKSEEVQRMLEGAEAMLQKRPHRQFLDELSRLKKTHEDALRSTQSLHKQLYPELQQKVHLMATTDNPLELLPKIPPTNSGDDEIVRKLEKLLDSVDEIKRERANLVHEFKQSLDDDDVIKHVVAASSEHQLKDVFDKEIKKHDKYLEPLQANLKRQDELLDSIERLNAQYGQVKLNHRSQRAAYTERVESLKKYHTQFKTISSGIEEGVNYQNKMVELVRNFYNKVRAANDINELFN